MSGSNKDLEVVKRHFLSNLLIGIVLTTPELAKFCKSKKLNVPMKNLRRLRRFWKFTAMFETPRAKPKYMSASILKYGTLMCDIGFLPDYKSSNRGITAFLAVKEMVSGSIGAVEIKNKTTDELVKAISTILAKGPFKQVHTLVWDREAAITSAKFRELVRNKYGIKVFFLKARNKAYLAELAVAYIKKRIAMKVEASKNKQWIGGTLQNIVRHYNNLYYPGTKFKRGKITRGNAELFLRAKLKMKNPTLTFNAATLEPSNIRNSDWKDKMFKYNIGDEVLVLKKANTLDPDNNEKPSKKQSNKDSTYNPRTIASKRRRRFQEKSSLTGAYSRKSYTVAERLLKSSNQWFWTAVYRLEGRSGFFYEA